MDKSDLRIDWASHAAAKYACEHWHYSKSVPVPPLVKVGVWESGKYIGVVLFSRGSNNNMLKPFGLAMIEGCELTRIALKKHHAPVSRIVKLALQFLRDKSPSVRLVVSYADPSKGHHGGVYQAGGWVYSGETSKDKQYIKNGKTLHTRQVSPSGHNIQQGQRRKCWKPSECDKVIDLPGKHRYLMPLDKAMKKQIEPLSKPYPKRVKLGDDCDQQHSGGATPTGTLQTNEVA